MDRRELGRKIDLILSQAHWLPLRSRPFEFYAATGSNTTLLSHILEREVAAPGEYELNGEQITLLLALNAQNPELLTDIEAILLDRLDDKTACMVGVTLLVLGRMETLGNLLTNATPGLQVRLWTAVETHLSMQPHTFSESDLFRLLDLSGQVRDTLKPLTSPLGKVDLGMLVGVSGSLIQVARELDDAITQVTNRITLVQYRRLRKELLEAENPALNTDKQDLTQKLGHLGFRSEIVDALGQVDKKLLSAVGPFDFKGCMDLLRTAFEEIVEASARKVATLRPRALPQGPRLNHFSPWREYLENEHVLTKDQGGMAQQLYNYLSNAGSHQLGAGPKEARLSKNMVIELGLMIVDQVAKL